MQTSWDIKPNILELGQSDHSTTWNFITHHTSSHYNVPQTQQQQFQYFDSILGYMVKFDQLFSMYFSFQWNILNEGSEQEGLDQ